MTLYLNALKYAIKKEHKIMQNMGYDEGDYSSEKTIGTPFLLYLCMPRSGSDEQKQYIYSLEKVAYLKNDSIEREISWGYTQLHGMLPFLEKYVTFQNADSEFEHYALVQLALYLECLHNKCYINKIVPNSLKFRNGLLSADEVSALSW